MKAAVEKGFGMSYMFVCADLYVCLGYGGAGWVVVGGTAADLTQKASRRLGRG